MALNAFHAFQQHEEVTVQSDDTDVLVVCIGLNKMFSGKLYIQHGTVVNLTTLNIKSVVSNLPDGVAEALLGLHPFTGCNNETCDVDHFVNALSARMANKYFLTLELMHSTKF